MHPDLVTLYNLQLADNHLRIARERIEKLDWGAAEQRAVTTLRAQAAVLAAEKAAAETALQQCENDLATAESRIQRTEKRIQSGEIHNAHEMESNEKELVTFRQRRGDLEEQALAWMEALEKVPARAHTIRSQEQALLHTLAEIRQRSTKEKARLEKEIEEVTARRSGLVSLLSEPVLKRFQQQQERHGGVGVARIAVGSCSECRARVHPSVVKAVLEGPDLVPCQNCGRYLYTDSDSASPVA
jgi:uncharacterized protein